VPLVVLLRGDARMPPPLNLAVVVPYRVRSGAAGQQDLKELRRYIENQQVRGTGVITETLFFKKSVRLFWFDFGKSDRENIDISYQVLTRMGPSLMITVPAFILGLGVNIFIAMIVAYCRGTYVDRMVAVICIVIMSILSLFYYFSSQLVFGVWLKVFPVSGYLPDFKAIRFVLLPILVSVVIGIGGGVRFYRTIFLEETNREYVRTARAKGLNQAIILFKHVLKNAMIPILTNVVLVIPMLFVGSLILESFFAIPGLGRFTLEGIQAQDFRIVGSMVYLGSFLYIVGLIMTDISYTFVDPRVRLE
jgi:peptide/nickel transport system permease protein